MTDCQHPFLIDCLLICSNKKKKIICTTWLGVDVWVSEWSTANETNKRSTEEKRKGNKGRGNLKWEQ
jgi:hypothetical protein